MMRKTTILTALLLLAALAANADKFVITDMDGSKTITINMRECRIGSEFTSDEIALIKWGSSNVTVIEAKNKKTKIYSRFRRNNGGETAKKSSPSLIDRLWNFVVGSKKLSSREVEDYSLEHALADGVQIADTVKIYTGETPPATRQYYARFYQDGATRTVPVTVSGQDLVFTREMFSYNGMTLPCKYFVTVWYTEDNRYHEITNAMPVELLPTRGE